MTKITRSEPTRDTVALTVRFFAAARDAAGRDDVALTLPTGSSVADAIRELCGQSEELALVLQKCSFLCDGVAVRDSAAPLHTGVTLDVLPPFSGG